MNKQLTMSALLCGFGLFCGPASASNNITNGWEPVTVYLRDTYPERAQFTIASGYVSVYATDEYGDFACSIWYTSPNFASFKETALAFVNLEARPLGTGTSIPSALITRDLNSNCKDMTLYATR